MTDSRHTTHWIRTCVRVFNQRICICSFVHLTKFPQFRADWRSVCTCLQSSCYFSSLVCVCVCVCDGAEAAGMLNHPIVINGGCKDELVPTNTHTHTHIHAHTRARTHARTAAEATPSFPAHMHPEWICSGAAQRGEHLHPLLSIVPVSRCSARTVV